MASAYSNNDGRLYYSNADAASSNWSGEQITAMQEGMDKSPPPMKGRHYDSVWYDDPWKEDEPEKPTLKMKEELCLCTKNLWN